MSEVAEEGGEWVSITEAAARLSAAGDVVDRSTLSRYISQHSEALATRRDGKANLVEFGQLAGHRAENVRLKRGPLSTQPLRSLARMPAGSVQPSRFVGSQSNGLARKANADAEMREMDLAQRRGELTPTAEVDQAGRDALALMQASFDRAVETHAANLSVRYGWDERVARLALKEFAKGGLDVFNRELRQRLDGMARDAMAAEAGSNETAASPSLQ